MTLGVNVCNRRYTSPYEELRNAIIERAVMDYRSAYVKRLSSSPDKRSFHIGKCTELERFFASEWCRILTELDMVVVAQAVREQCKVQHKKKLSQAMKGV